MNLKFRSESAADKRSFSESRNDYKLLELPGGRILDLGAHIGLFVANMAIREMEMEFLCVEASLSSYKLLQNNLIEIMSNFPKTVVNARHAAVVKDTLDGKVINIYEKANSETSNTIIPTRGRTPKSVFGIGAIRLCEEFKPTVVKCDIEGAEYDVAPPL